MWSAALSYSSVSFSYVTKKLNYYSVSCFLLFFSPQCVSNDTTNNINTITVNTKLTITLSIFSFVLFRGNFTATWKLLKWLKGTCTQTECTGVLTHVPLLIRSNSGAHVHLLRGRHSATRERSRHIRQRSAAMSFSTSSVGEWSSYLQQISKYIKRLYLVVVCSRQSYLLKGMPFALIKNFSKFHLMSLTLMGDQ